ncbi:hypothetical protein FBBAL38_13110 [Flavobacteria bacterium BAL38]|jgi:hypothetical protein|nr:hypothetical protein FBBAL38_13110 [Flavobacteria bacterium BAL38]
MKNLKEKTFHAKAVLGLQKGYSNKIISIEDFKTNLLKAQKKIVDKFGVGLSIQLTPCTIFFLGQDEPSISLEIIQYPKFPQPEPILKETFIQLIADMMIELEQNRTVIQFLDETIMLEQTDTINHKINYN